MNRDDARLAAWAAAAGGALVLRGVGILTAGPGRLAPTSRRILESVGTGVNAGTYDHPTQAAKEERHPAGTLIGDADDMVDEASKDSFPASDPPSYSPRAGV